MIWWIPPARCVWPPRPWKDEGAVKVVAYATHAVLSGGAVERISKSAIDELVVTDSIPLSQAARDCGRIRQLSSVYLAAGGNHPPHPRRRLGQFVVYRLGRFEFGLRGECSLVAANVRSCQLSGV